MAALKVVPVKIHVDGNLDLADLKEKAEKYTDNLAAFMVGIHPSPRPVLIHADYVSFNFRCL